MPWSRKPVSPVFGLDRGTPIDRHYISAFLAANAAAISGAILEFADDTYFGRYAAPGSTLAIFHGAPGNASATIVGDLGSADFLAGCPQRFDCIICTQVLQFIYPFHQATRNLYGMLRPGGVLLLTASGISQISRYDMDRWGDYWRFTSLSLKRLFEETCPDAEVEIEAHGNVLAAVAFLHGLSTEEVGAKALDRRDPDYEVSLCVRCRKPG
ncbi:MAG TPA: methyltransferase domain-containing protein [Caulobacteraceae bacterium]